MQRSATLYEPNMALTRLVTPLAVPAAQGHVYVPVV